MEISVVIPVYGCPAAIPELHRRLTETLTGMGVEYEIVMVDDCDAMGSWDEVRKVAEADPRVKAIRFTKNCGQDKAITAGVRAATGNWIVTMDCDLQDAPENIPLLYRTVREKGCDVVFVRRHQRKDPLVVQWLSKLFHRIFSYFSELSFDYELGTFLIASKRAADQYRRSRDRGRDFTMYLMWLGYACDYVDLEHEWRFEGKSSYTFMKKWRYAVSAMTTFSNRILYIPVWVGMVAALGSVAYILFVLISYFAFHNNPEGWSTLAAAVFFFGGAILSTLGIIGLYLGNVFDISKDRPLYVIQESINCDGER
ncbi:MAG: glycosyltransferase family 2 protein [Lachnospiraceae bacterium]|nr:glycosyltransferase family 2 protein [Lachnospiraceae bacterium]